MDGRHHQLNGHEFEQTLGDSDGQGNLTCCSSRGRPRVRDDLSTEQQQMSIHVQTEMAMTMMIMMMMMMMMMEEEKIKTNTDDFYSYHKYW